MKVQYFLKDGFLDEEALGGGIYQIDVGMIGHNKWLHLYVGEAGCIIKRCGQHLLTFSEDIGYLGLVEGDDKIENLVIRFSVNTPIHRRKKPYYDAEYIKIENSVKNTLKPLTQVRNESNDDMLPRMKKLIWFNQK